MICPLETDTPVAKLGETIRELMRRRRLTGVDLAPQIDISATALSQILNDVSKPRQSTFAKLLNRLTTNEEERQMLIVAYTGDPNAGDFGSNRQEDLRVEEAPAAPHAIEDEAAARSLEARAASAAFEDDIAKLLADARIPVIHPFLSEKVACDFVTKTKTRIAVLCKFGLNKDWERLLGTCLLLRKNLPADEIVVAIPYHNATSQAFEPDFSEHGIYLETPATLIKRLKKLGA